MRFYKLRITWWGGYAFPNKVIVQLELNEEISYLIAPDQKATVKRYSGKPQSHDQTAEAQVSHKNRSFRQEGHRFFTLKVTTLLSKVLGRGKSLFFCFWGVGFGFYFVCFKARVPLTNLALAHLPEVKLQVCRQKDPSLPVTHVRSRVWWHIL